MDNLEFQKLVLDKLDDLKGDVKDLQQKTQSVVEQTAELLEFRTETTVTLQDIRDSQLTLSHILGEHEVNIRKLMRKAI